MRPLLVFSGSLALVDGLARSAPLDANQDLRIARARVDEARSLATIAELALYPQISAEGGAVGRGGAMAQSCG